MKIMLRVDDIGWTSEESDNPPTKKRDVGLALAQKFHSALGGIPYLAGVIPLEVDNEGEKWINSRRDRMTVALHGFTHSDPTGDRHEFQGFSEARVRECIAVGQGKIGPTAFYIPPFNSLDSSHVETMWHEGIRYIFGRESEWATPPSPYELARGVKFIPAWARLYGALGWNQGAAKERLLDELAFIAESEEPGLAVMTLHLPWESARDPQFQHVKELSVYKDLFITPEDFVKEIK